MISKGVSSVRSPVCNLNQVKPGVTHDEFVQSVIKEFSAEFSTDNKVGTLVPSLSRYHFLSFCLQVHEVDMTEELCSVDYIQRGMRELQVRNISKSCTYTDQTNRRLSRAGTGSGAKHQSSHTAFQQSFHGATSYVLPALPWAKV